MAGTASISPPNRFKNSNKNDSSPPVKEQSRQDYGKTWRNSKSFQNVTAKKEMLSENESTATQQKAESQSDQHLPMLENTWRATGREELTDFGNRRNNLYKANEPFEENERSRYHHQSFGAFPSQSPRNNQNYEFEKTNPIQNDKATARGSPNSVPRETLEQHVERHDPQVWARMKRAGVSSAIKLPDQKEALKPQISLNILREEFTSTDKNIRLSPKGFEDRRFEEPEWNALPPITPRRHPTPDIIFIKRKGRNMLAARLKQEAIEEPFCREKIMGCVLPWKRELHEKKIEFAYEEPPRYHPQGQSGTGKLNGSSLERKRTKGRCLEKERASIVDKDENLSASADDFLQDSEESEMTEQHLIGRRTVSDWKVDRGRSKSWKRGSYTRLSTIRQYISSLQTKREAGLAIIRVEALRDSHFDPFVPIQAQRRKNDRILKCSESRSGIAQLRSEGRKLKDNKRDDERNIFKEDYIQALPSKLFTPKTREIHFPSGIHEYDAEAEECMRQLNKSTKRSPVPEIKSPVEFYYSGRVIPSPRGYFRLVQHLRSDAHGEIVSLERLYSGIKYYAKVYALKGIHKNQRKRRVENLKKMTSWDSMWFSFDFEGKKFCVFFPDSSNWKDDGEEIARGKRKGIGTIRRWSKEDYDAAFPALPSTSLANNTSERQPTEQSSPGEQLQVQALQLVANEVLKITSEPRTLGSEKLLALTQRLLIQLTELNNSLKEDQAGMRIKEKEDGMVSKEK